MRRFLFALLFLCLSLVGGTPLNVEAKSNYTPVVPPIYEGIQGDIIDGFYSREYVLYAGQTTVAGELLIHNDETTLYLDFTTLGIIEEIHVYLYGVNDLLPVSRPVPGKAPYHLSNVLDDQATLAIPLTPLIDGSRWVLAVHVAFTATADLTDPIALALAGETAYAAGETTPSFPNRGAWFYLIGFTVKVGQVIDLTSETAWAYGGLYAVPFTTLGITNRWGWTNGPLVSGTYLFPLVASAGNNVLTHGTIVGTVKITIYGTDVTVTYTTYQGFTLEDIHLYVGSSPLPWVRQGQNYVMTASPGQFPIVIESINSSNYVIAFTNLPTSLYVAAHAIVVGPYIN